MPVSYLWGSWNNLTVLTGVCERKYAYHDGFSHLAPAYLNGIEVTRVRSWRPDISVFWILGNGEYQECAAELIKSDRWLCKAATEKECNTQIPARILIASLLVDVCRLRDLGRYSGLGT
jgi:hypothetical protein